MVLSSRELCLASASLLVAVIQLAAQSPPAEFKQAGTEQVGTRHVRAWVTGRVVVEGYKVPPQSVAVSMNCGGLPRTQAYTESDGHFGFEPTFAPSLSASSPVGADSERTAAEIQGVQGIESSVASQWNCRLSANLAGYTSSQLDVGLLGPDGATLLSYSDQASVGDIVLRRLESLTGHAVSSTMADAPDVAVAEYEQGMLLLRKPKPNDRRAALHLERAVEAYPEFAEAWVALGEARWALGNRAEATQAFTRSINADPKFLPAYEMLIYIVFENKDWSELELLTERYLAMSTHSPMVLYMSAVAAVELGKFSRAELRILALQLSGYYDNWPKSRVILGLIHESRSEFQEAAKYYNWYLYISRDANLNRLIRRKLYDWKMLQVFEPKKLIDRTADQ